MALEARYTDEDIRAMVDDGIVDPHVEDSLRAMQSEVSSTLQERAEFPSIAQLDWVDYIEQTAVKLAREMEEDGEDLWHGADVFATRPGEEGLVSELRSQAAWYDARRAEAEEIASGARRLRHTCLGTVATAETVDIVCLGAVDYIEHVFKEMPHVASSPAEQMAAARAQANGRLKITKSQNVCRFKTCS